ncbi:MAG: helicase-associated domain-containing protein [Treponema sp.]|nr:helicase-associated domain-containing protein [Treponema sp.]
MKTLNPLVKHIMDWRESMTLISEEHFFQIVRTYLGEIETPYNKQDVIEKLGAFLRNEENLKNMILLLDNNDIQILTALYEIPEATDEKLNSFFGSNNTAIEYRLQNLEERLVIYRHLDSHSQKKIISINPYVENIFSNIADLHSLIPETICVEKIEDENHFASTSFIAALFSYIAKNPELCKTDFSLKKRNAKEISDIFSIDKIKEKVELLIKSFLNLRILKEINGKLFVDYDRANLFASLPEKYRYAYICAGSQGHLQRKQLQEQAQMFLDVIASIKDGLYTKKTLSRISFLINETNNAHNVLSSNSSTGRFALLMAQNAEKNENVSISINFENLIDTAALLGLLKITGKNEQGEYVYTKSYSYNDFSEQEQNEKALSIDASFNVMCLSNLSLSNMIELSKFMDIKRFDTAASFEINKQSVMRAFNEGYTNKSLVNILKRFSLYELPQNIIISIDEWYQTFTSVTLYKGFILQVSLEKAVLIEKNPIIANHIKKTIAPGIFLLDTITDEEVNSILAKSDLDFVREERSETINPFVQSYPILHEGKAFIEEEIKENSKAFSNKNRLDKIDSYQDSLRKKVENENLDKEQKREILSRIQRKIIINDSQLKKENIKIEILEASGMDFSGKIHVIESAIMDKCMIEIEYDGNVIECKPLSVEKKTGNAELLFLKKNEKKENLLAISRILHIKRLSQSLFEN